jgi:hypothetical protein
VPQATLRLDVPLPTDDGKFDRGDVAWAIQELHQHTPLNVMEEIQEQNQELLDTLRQLQEVRRELVCLQGMALRPVAA